MEKIYFTNNIKCNKKGVKMLYFLLCDNTFK